MANYDDLKLEELRELAAERDLEGRSGLNKSELKALLEADDAGDSVAESDEEKQEALEEALEGKEAFDELSDEGKELADLEADAEGPLNVQSPYVRVTTGAVSEEQAKEQEKERAKLPDDFVGNFPEKLSDEDVQRAEDFLNGPKAQDPATDLEYPAPLAEQEAALRERAGEYLNFVNERKVANTEDVVQQSIRETQGEDKRTVGVPRAFDQRAVLYTDDLSGPGADRLDRSYRNVTVKANPRAYFHAADPNEEEVVEEEKSE